MIRRAGSDWKSPTAVGRSWAEGWAQEDDAERRRRHSHAERGNEFPRRLSIRILLSLSQASSVLRLSPDAELEDRSAGFLREQHEQLAPAIYVFSFC